MPWPEGRVQIWVGSKRASVHEYRKSSERRISDLWETLRCVSTRGSGIKRARGLGVERAPDSTRIGSRASTGFQETHIQRRRRFPPAQFVSDSSAASAGRTYGSDNISDVGNRGSGGGSQVEDLLSGGDVDVVQSSEDTSGQLGPEGVPHAVLDLLSREVGVGRSGLDGDSLLAVDRVSGDEVAGDEEVLLAL